MFLHAVLVFASFSAVADSHVFTRYVGFTVNSLFVAVSLIKPAPRLLT